MSNGHIKIGDFDISKPAEQRATWLATELRTNTQVETLAFSLYVLVLV